MIGKYVPLSSRIHGKNARAPVNFVIYPNYLAKNSTVTPDKKEPGYPVLRLGDLAAAADDTFLQLMNLVSAFV